MVQDTKPPRSDSSFYALITGGIVAALLAGSCCLGPLLFLVFGISMGSLSFLQIFAPFHLYFVAVSLLIMGSLWYDYFARRRYKKVCSTALCKNYKLYLVLGTLFVAVLVTYQYWIGYFLEDA